MSSRNTLVDELAGIGGEHVRAIVEYGDDGIDVVRMDDAARDGIDPEAKLPLLKRVAGETLPSEPFGPRQLSVHVLSDLIVLHLPFDGTDGVIATLERTTPDRILGELATSLRTVEPRP